MWKVSKEELVGLARNEKIFEKITTEEIETAVNNIEEQGTPYSNLEFMIHYMYKRLLQ